MMLMTDVVREVMTGSASGLTGGQHQPRPGRGDHDDRAAAERFSPMPASEEVVAASRGGPRSPIDKAENSVVHGPMTDVH